MEVIDDDEIYTVWHICQDVYKNLGYDLNFPKDTDPKKTYQWRYIKSIVSKFRLWDLTADEMAAFIKIAAEQVKSSGLLHKGLSVLHQNNILDISFEKYKRTLRNEDQNINLLLKHHKWLLKQAKGDSIRNTLLKKQGSMKNIVLWYQSNSISALYIALSKMCMLAYAQLSSAELSMMPTKSQLYLIRQDFMVNPKAKQIMQEINQINVNI